LGGVKNGLETGFRVMRSSAEDDQFAFDASEIYLGGFAGYGDNDNLYLNLNFKQFDFDAAEPVSGEVRDEIESRYVLGYNHDFAEGIFADWTLNTELSFTKNNSNVDAFSYERTLFTINFARYFI